MTHQELLDIVQKNCMRIRTSIATKLLLLHCCHQISYITQMRVVSSYVKKWYKVIAEKGSKFVYNVIASDKSQIIVLACCGASWSMPYILVRSGTLSVRKAAMTYGIPKSTLSDKVVKVCIAMMLPLICLTRTPSNRTSRARVDHVTGWRVTMSYNELLICNSGCDPGCNTGDPGRFCQRSAGPSTQSGWRPRAWFLKAWVVCR